MNKGLTTTAIKLFALTAFAGFIFMQIGLGGAFNNISDAVSNIQNGPAFSIENPVKNHFEAARNALAQLNRG